MAKNVEPSSLSLSIAISSSSSSTSGRGRRASRSPSRSRNSASTKRQQQEESVAPKKVGAKLSNKKQADLDQEDVIELSSQSTAPPAKRALRAGSSTTAQQPEVEAPTADEEARQSSRRSVSGFASSAYANASAIDELGGERRYQLRKRQTPVPVLAAATVSAAHGSAHETSAAAAESLLLQHERLGGGGGGDAPAATKEQSASGACGLWRVKCSGYLKYTNAHVIRLVLVTLLLVAVLFYINQLSYASAAVDHCQTALAGLRAYVSDKSSAAYLYFKQLLGV